MWFFSFLFYLLLQRLTRIYAEVKCFNKFCLQKKKSIRDEIYIEIRRKTTKSSIYISFIGAYTPHAALKYANVHEIFNEIATIERKKQNTQKQNKENNQKNFYHLYRNCSQTTTTSMTTEQNFGIACEMGKKSHKIHLKPKMLAWVFYMFYWCAIHDGVMNVPLRKFHLKKTSIVCFYRFAIEIQGIGKTATTTSVPARL